MTVAVLVATRDRPEQAYQTWQTFMATKFMKSTQIIFGIDYDEPQKKRYVELLGFNVWDAGPYSGSLTSVTNGLAEIHEDFKILGSVGDDHRFRTHGWDKRIIEALEKPGVAYPDDGFQHQQLATAFFASNDIVKGLGWLALPVCNHMYIDNAIMDIGKGLNNLKYLPSVKIEHLHPAAGKGTMDASYQKTNARSAMDRDKQAYDLWRRHEYSRDMARLRRHLNG